MVATGSESAPLRVVSRQGADDVPGSAVGTTLGDYQLVRYLGRGGMADVYAAVRPDTGGGQSRVAIKRFFRRLSSAHRMVGLFLHEAKLSTMLSHPNLVKGIDFGVEDGTPYLVLELVDGVPCDAVQRWRGPSPLPPRLALHIVQRVLRALTFVHEARNPAGQPLRVVHQDVSPDNVLINRFGQVKLSDFGVARSALAPDLGSRVRGKLGYMSPEQVAGLETDARSDLFSVGVLLADLALGRRLFDRGSELDLLVAAYECEISSALSELGPELGDVLGGVLKKALARDRDRRFQSARAFERAVMDAAARLGGLPDSGELAVWLIERGLIGSSSGARVIGALDWPGANDVVHKIDGARQQVLTADPDPPAQPRLRAVARPSAWDRYAVREPNGTETARVSLAELIELVVTGRASSDTLVAGEGRALAPLHTHPALCFLARTVAYRFSDGAEARASFSVPFERSRLPSQLFGLARSGARGLLTVRAGKRHKRVFYDSGLPCFVASSDPAELLGRQVVRSGLIEASELDEAVAMASRQGRRLGDALVANGLCQAGVMMRLLLSQLSDRVLELGTWVEGQISFTPGPRAGLTAPGPLGPAATLPCRMVRERYSDTEIAALAAGVRDGPLVLVPGTYDLPLTDQERTVLERIRDVRQLDALELELARDGVATPLETDRAVFLGLSAQLVVSPRW